MPAQYPTSKPALLALVGEAYGAEEEAADRPFVGAAGRLLNTILYHLNIARSDCLVTNVFNERPPNNDITRWCSKQADSSALFPHIRYPIRPGAYLPADRGESALLELQRDLRANAPRVIVALGSTAAWALLGKRIKMKSVRGALVSDGPLGPWPIIPTWHPAYILRNFTSRTMLEADLLKALQVAAGTYRPLRPEVAVAQSVAQVADYFNAIGPDDLTAVDIETKRGDIDCIGFSHDGQSALVVPFVNIERKPFRRYWSARDEEEVLSCISTFLTNPKRRKCFQNGQYDVWWIYHKWGIFTLGWTDDTRLLHHAIWPDQPKDLANMAATHLNLPAWKASHQEREK